MAPIIAKYIKYLKGRFHFKPKLSIAYCPFLPCHSINMKKAIKIKIVRAKYLDRKTGIVNSECEAIPDI